jgi:hypothetical protein
MPRAHVFLPFFRIKVQIFQYLGAEMQGELKRKTSGNHRLLTQTQTTYNLTWGMLGGFFMGSRTIRGQV